VTIEYLDKESGSWSVFVDKVNELIDAHNKMALLYDEHIHYAREMQYPTSTPNNPDVYSS